MDQAVKCACERCFCTIQPGKGVVRDGKLIVSTDNGVFTAKVMDAHGLPVFVEVYSFRKWGGQHVTTFCGETTRAVEFEPGAANIRDYVTVEGLSVIQAASPSRAPIRCSMRTPRLST